jgi:signal transduction histidine kinase
MAPLRLVPSEIAFLRFVAGIRALLATLCALALLADQLAMPSLYMALMLVYLGWAAWLLWKTLHGWPLASSRLWLWFDAAALLVTSQMVAHSMPLFGISTVLPVVAMAILAGAAQAMVLAVACAAAMLAAAGSFANVSALPPLPVSVPIIVLALGPAAALLARPSRDLRLRLKLVETLNERSDPRQGLRHHVDMLLEQLAVHFDLRAATISLQGPEPRIFQRLAGQPANELASPESDRWRRWLTALPRDVGCLLAAEGSITAGAAAVHLASGVRSRALDDETRRTLEHIGTQALSIPLMNYGQPLGTLCLQRDEPAFDAADVRWLGNVMNEIMPLLERSDLLEQLQHETASRERERIGRDLHDSAVQPYLGLKYGLEALARRAGPANPISPQIDQLVGLATEELQTLRDVISGLRRGDDPGQADGAPLAALQREAQRFEALYGLKVNIFAPQAPRLRGSAAKAVLHMVNEALTNARRHTSATAVTVLLDVNKSDVVLRLRNDHGREDTLPEDFLPLSLTQRATELGGSVEIEHQPDFTEIVITLPMLGAIG